MISVRNLSYRYRNSERDVLSSLSLEFADGSFTAMMGANGSGKSTLGRCLNGLRRPTSGDVVVDGMNTKSPESIPQIRRRVGLVFQDPGAQVTSATVERELAFGMQNFGIPMEEIQRSVAQELQLLGLSERRLSSPASLSGGERQRLALAATLILEPNHLVLDEPTSHLSLSSRRHLMEKIIREREKRSTTIILITQFLDEALRADRLIVLHDSRIVFNDSPRFALSRPEQLFAWGIFVSPGFVAHT